LPVSQKQLLKSKQKGKILKSPLTLFKKSSNSNIYKPSDKLEEEQSKKN
jgi:hypothetical protein